MADTAQVSQSERLQILYSIVQQARTPQLLQDAKDVFDYLFYEMDTVPSRQSIIQLGGIQKLPDRAYLNFLRDEIRHLRMQLDVITKQMAGVPEKESNE